MDSFMASIVQRISLFGYKNHSPMRKVENTIVIQYSYPIFNNTIQQIFISNLILLKQL